MRDNSLRTPLEAPASPIGRSSARPNRLVENYPVVESNSMDAVQGAWGRNARLAVVLGGGLAAWGLVIVLVMLLS